MPEGISEKLKNSVIYHWDLLCVMVFFVGTGFLWASANFANIAEAAEQTEAHLEERLTDLENIVTTNGQRGVMTRAMITETDGKVDQLILNGLYSERREIIRAIRVLNRLVNSGEATDNDFMELDDLEIDLIELESQITRAENGQ